MAIKTILTVLLVIFSIELTNGQTINIKYEFVNKSPNDPVMATKETYELKSNREKSLYTKTSDDLLYVSFESSKTKEEDGTTTEKISDNHYRIHSERKQMIFKDFGEGILEYNTLIHRKEVTVKEYLGEMDWDITERDTTFLDFACKIAITTFKGRKWTVFFTEQLGFNAAPWKFSGLPGTILYAISEDQVYSFNAILVNTSTDDVKIVSPFTKKDRKKMLSWEEYKKVYYETIKKVVRKMNSVGEEEDGVSSDAKATLDNPIEDLGFTEVK